MTASKLLELARTELGVKESPRGSNNVKYNTAYYGGPVRGEQLSWCCVFLWWLFREAGASELFFNGKKTAYCPALLAYHRHIGQGVSGAYHPGDIVFFDFNGNGAADHVGLCESFDGTWVTTIDGNTGTDSQANGGCVMRRRRHKKYIVGAVRPAYTEEDEEMDESQFDKLMENWLEGRRKAEPSGEWGGEAREWARETGLISGDERGNPQWEGLVTRNQLVTVLYKFWKMILKRVK